MDCMDVLWVALSWSTGSRSAKNHWCREAQALTMSNFSSIEHSLVLVIKVVTMIKHTKLRFVGAVQ